MLRPQSFPRSGSGKPPRILAPALRTLVALSPFLASSCASTAGRPAGVQSAPEARGVDARARHLMSSARRGNLSQGELTEAFLLAESLVQQRDVKGALDLYLAVFEAQASMVVGLKIVRLHALLGDLPEAEAFARRIALFYPKSPHGELALASVATLRGQRPRALEILAETHRKHPGDEDVVNQYVDLLIELEQRALAVRILKESLRDPSPSPALMLRLARLHAEAKEYAAAKALLETLMRASPETVEAWTLAGFIASEQKDDAAAESYFREAYERQPENDVLARLYVGHLMRAEKYQAARRLLARLESTGTAADPIDPELTFQFGVVLFQLEEFEEARKRFVALLPATEDPGRFLYFAGQCEEALRRPEDALATYAKIPAASEYAARAGRATILVNLELGRFEPARAEFTKWKEAKASLEAEEYRFRANVSARLEDYADARASAHAGSLKFPNSPELAFLSASYLENLKGPDEALREMEEVHKRFPKYAPVLNHLGYTFAVKGIRLEEALRLLTKAVEAEPGNGMYLDSLAWAHFRAGRALEAEALLEKALQKEPGEPVIHEHRAEVALSRSQAAVALKHFEGAEALFAALPKWKTELDPEWRASRLRVGKRIRELRDMALPKGAQAATKDAGTE